MDLQHASQRTKKGTSLLPHQYKWMCILRTLSITEGFISVGLWSWSNSDLNGQSNHRPKHIRCSSIFFRWFYAVSCCWFRAAFQGPAVSSLEERDDFDALDSAPYRAALYRPVVGPVEERYDLDAEDPAPDRAALHRPVVKSAEEKDDLDAGD